MFEIWNLLDAINMHEVGVIFALMVALDFAWAKYTLSIQGNAHCWASALAGLIFLLNGAVTIAYVDSPWMLIPAVAGAVVGTYLGSRMKR